MQVKAFRAIIIISISQNLAVGAYFCGPKAEIGFVFGQFIFIKDKLVRAARNGLAIMLAILRALFEFRPINIIAILLRDAAVILFDAALHFLKNRFGQLGLRGHLCFKIGIFGAQMRQDFRIINHWIAGITQPVIIIANRHIVIGCLMRTLDGDRRLDVRGGFFGHGFFLGKCGRR